jgi:hypothetical protein
VLKYHKVAAYDEVRGSLRTFELLKGLQLKGEYCPRAVDCSKRKKKLLREKWAADRFIYLSSSSSLLQEILGCITSTRVTSWFQTSQTSVTEASSNEKDGNSSLF